MADVGNSTSPKAPRPLRRGPKWLQNAYNDLLAYSCQTTPLAGPQMSSQQGPNGIMLTPQVSSGVITHIPFQLAVASPTQIRVYLGTVNGNAPDDFSPGDTPPFLLSVSGDGVVFIEVTTDAGGTITDVSVSFDASMPADSAGDYHQQIGSFSSSGGSLVVAQAIGGSQWFELCGGVVPLWGLV